VAKFGVPAHLKILQGRIEELRVTHGIGRTGAKRKEGEGEGEGEEWIAHCTLGKIKARSKDVSKVGYRAIEAIMREQSLVLLQNMKPIVHGLKLSGEVPKQVYVDWDASLCFGIPRARFKHEAERECVTIRKLGPQCMGCILQNLDREAMSTFRLVSTRMRARLFRFFEEYGMPSSQVGIAEAYLTFDFGLVLSLEGDVAVHLIYF